MIAVLPTPLEPADRLGAALGLAPGQLWVKRDDLTGLAGGGNKARKLVLLCEEAQRAGADVLVTGGGRQSNHCRQTAAAAARLGLGCRIVLGGDGTTEPTGNVVLDLVLGADIVWAPVFDHREVEARIDVECAALEAEGRRPYRVPIGGASPTGVLAYELAVAELATQIADVALHVVADGSGGTHAGLADGCGRWDAVLGVDVGARDDLADALPGLANRAPAGTPVLDATRIGDAYGAPTDAALEAIRLFAATEGLILDPVYTGKAGAALLAAAREGRLPDGRIVFWHTGGMPALFSPRYAEWIRG